jgi:hypothetical protein
MLGVFALKALGRDSRSGPKWFTVGRLLFADRTVTGHPLPHVLAGKWSYSPYATRRAYRMSVRCCSHTWSKLLRLQ